MEKDLENFTDEELWTITKCTCGHPACSNYHLSIARSNGGLDEADARRILACVKACKGIKTIDLLMDNSEFIHAMRERDEFIAQKKELLNILKNANKIFDQMMSSKKYLGFPDYSRLTETQLAIKTILKRGGE